MFNSMFVESKEGKCFKGIKCVFRSQANIYDGVFLWINLTGYYFHNKNLCLTGLYICLQKYWNFLSEPKVEQIIPIVTTRNVTCFVLFLIR